ncbi:acyl-CoA reductase [Chitinophagaceae bacterium IBVUCB1]|nr:acyl-CoA reductase [Chitinophagaceae bacterium IBVUCB1]
MSTEQRISLLVRLRDYLQSNSEEWQDIIARATNMNAWFTTGNIELAVRNICTRMLDADKLLAWMQPYTPVATPKRVGIVAAGNIPLVGFHDALCGFMSGQQTVMKLSSKDEVLLRHILQKLTEWKAQVAAQMSIADNLKGCDAYIATGSNNTARYFEEYFGKYPHIIRKNRTSVAVLDGTETTEELSLLMDDVFTYFGLGCRNVTQVCLPQGYDISLLMEAAKKYDDIIHHHKYKNNYDYYLAIYLLNKVPYYTNDTLLMVENAIPFSAVSVLHYRWYENKDTLISELTGSEDIQCMVGHGHTPFGSSQSPALTDYADGVDTMAFLTGL